MTRDTHLSLGSASNAGSPHGDVPTPLPSGDRGARTPRRARSSSSPPPAEGRSRRAPARLLPRKGARTTNTEPISRPPRWPRALALVIACVLLLAALLVALR